MKFETNSLVIHVIPFHPNIFAIHKRNMVGRTGIEPVAR